MAETSICKESSPLLVRYGDDELSVPASGTYEKSKTSFPQTVLNIVKMCMGTGTLALPFSASQGGLLFNVIGLTLITLMNVASIDRLLKCVDYIQKYKDQLSLNIDVEGNRHNLWNGSFAKAKPLSLKQQFNLVSTSEDSSPSPFTPSTSSPLLCTDEDTCEESVESQEIIYHINSLKLQEPPNSGTFGKTAWYAFGSIGLQLIDLIMLVLMFGILIACEGAILSFIEKTPFTTGIKGYDVLMMLLGVLPLASIPDLGLITKFSAVGIFGIFWVYIVIVIYGLKNEGVDGFRMISSNAGDMMWPSNFTAFSNWFGVAVFGYGVVPFTYNLQEAMNEPGQMKRATMYGLSFVLITYLAIGDIVTIIFLPYMHGFDGDILSVFPDTWVLAFVRVAMALVIATTIPLLIIPTGDLLVEKIGIRPDQKHASKICIFLRLFVCSLCAYISTALPNFVYVVSFIGCFCVALLSFVYPPLVHLVCFLKYCPREKQIYLRKQYIIVDLTLLLLGVSATAFTSFLTYRSLLEKL